MDGSAGIVVCVAQVAEGDPADRCRSGAIRDSYKARDPTTGIVPTVAVLMHVNININVYTLQ